MFLVQILLPLFDNAHRPIPKREFHIVKKELTARFPDKQDLNVELLALAKKAGCYIAIDTDAHHPWQLEFAEFGLAAVLKAKIDPKKIINFWRISDLLSWLKN